MGETKHEKFKRLATVRTNVILDRLHQLGKLSNKSNYYYTDAEINNIFRTIEQQVKEARTRFKSPKKVKIEL